MLLLSIVLRKDWLATIAGCVLAIGVALFPGESPLLDIFFTALCTGIFIFGLMRFGLLTAVFAFLCIQLLDVMPLTTNFSAWFASSTILVVLILFGLAFYGAFTSIGGRTAFKGPGSGTLPSS